MLTADPEIDVIRIRVSSVIRSEPTVSEYSKKDVFYKWENEYWDNEAIEKLTGITQFI